MYQRLRVFASCGLIALAVAACTGDRYLAALGADPMVSYEADELELFNVMRQRRAGPQLITGGYTVPRHVRQFEVDQTEAAEAFADAVAFAEANGWSPEGRLMPDPTEERFVAGKDLGVGRGRLLIAVDRDPEEFDDPDLATLTIGLRFSGISDEEDD